MFREQVTASALLLCEKYLTLTFSRVYLGRLWAWVQFQIGRWLSRWCQSWVAMQSNVYVYFVFANHSLISMIFAFLLQWNIYLDTCINWVWLLSSMYLSYYICLMTVKESVLQQSYVTVSIFFGYASLQ